MEIKHTIEILTKDIQDIEKLVRNLNNYPTVPLIELDLAMSKLRGVYELLSMISSDSKTLQKQLETERTDAEIGDADQAERQDETTESTKEELSPDPITLAAENNEIETNKQEPMETAEEKQSEDKTEIISVVAEEEGIPDQHSEPPKKQKEASILAEKFATDKSLSEKIAHGANADISSVIKGGPIDTIKRNIGINDRFLIIRELMNGDNEGFNQLIQKLDDCTNFNEAFKQIQTRFPDYLEHDGIKILINLARRKFISRGNV